MPEHLEDVEVDLGLRNKRTTPRPNYNNFSQEILEQLQKISEMMELDESNLVNHMESETVRPLRKSAVMILALVVAAKSTRNAAYTEMLILVASVVVHPIIDLYGHRFKLLRNRRLARV